MATKKDEFKLPKYLGLARGAMWFDTDGENASGVRLFAVQHYFVGRGFKVKEGKRIPNDEQIVNYKVDPVNSNRYGYLEGNLDWYVDTTKIDSQKLGNLISAYKHGILTPVDPKNPPKPPSQRPDNKNFKIDNKGDIVFKGKNKEMYKRLQNYNFEDLKKFVNNSPINEKTRIDLVDLLDYEMRGYNRLSRARLEVMDLIRRKLNEYGPGISPIRINEDEEEK